MPQSKTDYVSVVLSIFDGLIRALSSLIVTLADVRNFAFICAVAGAVVVAWLFATRGRRRH